jgi:hypothetical protein
MREKILCSSIMVEGITNSLALETGGKDELFESRNG